MSYPAQAVDVDNEKVGDRPTLATHTGAEAEIQQLMERIDVRDMQSIVFFGAQAQETLTDLSDQILGGLRNKDTGDAGEALNEMVSTLRGFDASRLESDARPSWIDRLKGKSGNIARALQRYETVRDQIESISARMEQHQTGLLIDIESLERLYDAGVDSLHSIENYITAGNRRLQQLEQEELPRLRSHAQADNNTLASQSLRDMHTARDQLERRVHDLQLSRQVLLQNLPAIRLIQENDRMLVAKIQSTLANTLPLWRQQLAQALTIQRSREAAASLEAATNLTNDLLRANAESLQSANREIRSQTERGIFDIEAIEEANMKLIETINESIDIAEQGREAREQANERLQVLEHQLRDSLTAASSRQKSLAGKTHIPKHRGAKQHV